MKYAPTIGELVTADGVAAKDITTSDVWWVRSTSSDAPRFEVSRCGVGFGHSPSDGWAFIDYCSNPRSAHERAIDTDEIFVSESKALQRQAELYLAAAVAMTKKAAAGGVA